MSEEQNSIQPEDNKPEFTEQTENLQRRDSAGRKNSGGKFLSYLMVAILSAAVTAGIIFCVFIFGGIGNQNKLSKLDQLEKLIEQRFIGEVDKTKMEDAAAAAMVHSLGDRWSYYIPAKEFQSYSDSMQNSYVGVGMIVAMREDGKGIDIRQVTAGGPAEEQGILPGDILIRVSDTDVTKMDVSSVRDLVIGEEGTEVRLTVLRKGESLSFTVTRRQFDTPVSTGELLDSGFGLIKIKNFNTRCSEETISAIDDLIARGAKGLIFDVRNNPGGYKHELVKVLDYLLPEGKLFCSVDYRGKEEVDMSGADCIDLPMMVLVNKESYSAAEFFAAALKEYGVAEIVGEQTCGKGYFQITTKLSDGSAVGLSMGKYFTPNGVSLADEGGLTPDYPVEISEDMFLKIYADLLKSSEDPQIQKAVERLAAG